MKSTKIKYIIIFRTKQYNNNKLYLFVSYLPTKQLITLIDTIQYFLNTLYKKNLKKKKQFLDNSSNPLCYIHGTYILKKKPFNGRKKKKREIKKKQVVKFHSRITV